MNIDVQEYTAKLTTITKSTLKVAPVRGDLMVYKLTSNRSHAQEGQFLISRPGQISSKEGIALRSDIDAFLTRGDAVEKALTLSSDIADSPWCFFKQAGREYFAKNGFNAHDKEGEKIISGALVENRAYTAFLSGEVTADDLTYFCGASQMLFDADLNPLPVAIYLDYIDARLNNKMYDLKKASQILRARTDIQFLNDRGDRINPSKTSVIFDIPHYNREFDNNRCMYALWTPSSEDMKVLWQKCKALRPSKTRLRRRELIDTYPYVHRHLAIFEADLLGLRAGGAALCTDYYYGHDTSSSSTKAMGGAEDFGQFDDSDD